MCTRLKLTDVCNISITNIYILHSSLVRIVITLVINQGLSQPVLAYYYVEIKRMYYYY